MTKGARKGSRRSRLLPFLAALGVLGVAQGQLLTLRAEAGQTVLELSLAQSARWDILWRHSVTLMTVRDSFAWRQGRLILLESAVPQLDAAGFGDTPGRGRLESDGAGGLVLRDLNEAVPGNGYWLRVGSRSAPTVLVHAGRRYPLSARYAGKRLWLGVALGEAVPSEAAP